MRTQNNKRNKRYMYLKLKTLIELKQKHTQLKKTILDRNCKYIIAKTVTIFQQIKI